MHIPYKNTMYLREIRIIFGRMMGKVMKKMILPYYILSYSSQNYFIFYGTLLLMEVLNIFLKI